jgi:hypothetical protein
MRYRRYEKVSHFKMRIGGRTLVLPNGEQDVGRMADCWLTLEDDLISRYHARLHVTDDRLEVEDLGSRNGTYVNGDRIEGRVELCNGDRVRFGREVIAVLSGEVTTEEAEADLRRTLAPGEDTQFPALIGQLIEKSLKAGHIKEAERYALALTNQLMAQHVPASHATARSCIRCLLALAERTSAGVWIDRVFRLHEAQSWVMASDVLKDVRNALDRIPRVPGTALADYERALRNMERDGMTLPAGLTKTVAELADAFGGA